MTFYPWKHSDDNSEIPHEKSRAKSQLIKPINPSVHDLEIQKVDDVDFDDDDIFSLETQKNEDNSEHLCIWKITCKKTINQVKPQTCSIHDFLETQKIDDIGLDPHDILSMET